MDITDLPSTADFEMKIVEAVKALDVPCYGVYNKHTEVLEHKDSSITRCYGAITEMQKEYTKMMTDIESTKAANKIRAKGSVHSIGGGSSNEANK